MSSDSMEPAHLIMPLYSISAEILGLAALIESERPDHLDLTEDEINARRGLGLLLKRLAKQVHEYGGVLDEWSTRKGRYK